MHYIKLAEYTLKMKFKESNVLFLCRKTLAKHENYYDQGLQMNIT